MSSNLTIHQFFSLITQLSAQEDYQALTHEFLVILAEIPWTDSATIYEVYNHQAATGSACELLIRRFPLDFTRDDEDHSNVLVGLDYMADLNLCTPNKSGLYAWAIFSIKGSSGPDRIIRLEGMFDKEMLELLSNLCGIYRNLVILHDSKERDLLTKLPNRQSLDARLLQVCKHYRDVQVIDVTQKTNSWIAMLDIDHFKRVNDDFGHLYGDEVLLIFSQLMEKYFRYNDFLFRFGGEEFVIILNLASQDMAVAVFNRFREMVANYKFSTVGQVTVSIGLTRIDSISMPTTQLDHADKALYRAKDSGRNQVVLYEDMPVFIQNSDFSDIELF